MRVPQLQQRTQNTTSLELTPPECLMKVYHGQKAIDEVVKKFDLQCVPDDMAQLILHEGFCEEFYEDDKGVKTTGVGQTGKYAHLPFPIVYDLFRTKAAALTPNYAQLPPKVQAAILSATYRGDWRQSKKTRELFNKGEYLLASKEFLNNAEYRSRKAKGDDGVTKRMEHIAEMIGSLA